MSAKPFEPTPSRLTKARRDGDHPLAHDAVALGAFGLAALSVLAGAGTLTGAARGALMGALQGRVDAGAFLTLACAAACVGAAAAAGAFIATLLQTGGVAWHAPEWKFERLALGPGLKRMAGGEAAVAALRGSVLAGVASCMVLGIFATRLEAFVHPLSIGAAVALACASLGTLFAAVFTAGLVFVALDVGVTRAAWRRRLRMSHDEVRRDQKEHDGDPNQRAMQRFAATTLVRGSVRAVREASFVIANPTHVAVAVRYVPEDTPVPAILVRAADAGAERVKLLARAHGIPIVEDVALARALYDGGVLGPIPRDLYLAVAYTIATLAREQST